MANFNNCTENNSEIGSGWTVDKRWGGGGGVGDVPIYNGDLLFILISPCGPRQREESQAKSVYPFIPVLGIPCCQLVLLREGACTQGWIQTLSSYVLRHAESRHAYAWAGKYSDHADVYECVLGMKRCLSFSISRNREISWTSIKSSRRKLTVFRDEKAYLLRCTQSFLSKTFSRKTPIFFFKKLIFNFSYKLVRKRLRVRSAMFNLFRVKTQLYFCEKAKTNISFEP
jgi:hypothetical protein